VPLLPSRGSSVPNPHEAPKAAKLASQTAKKLPKHRACQYLDTQHQPDDFEAARDPVNGLLTTLAAANQ